jgi:Fe-S cluster biogenesis protein NfuA
MAGPTTWQRVEELVRRLVGLYGDALGRILAASGADGAPDPALAARLCDDELVSSLLLLHGLHPIPAAERVARAVEALRARLAPDVAIELTGLGEDGVVRLRVAGEASGCGGAGAALARSIEGAILEAAPEVSRVEIEGATPERRERLVTLGAPRAAGVAPE